MDHAARLWGDPEVMKFIDRRGGLSGEGLVAKLECEIENERRYGVQYWPVFEGEEFIGCCGLKPWVHSARGGHELGFHIVREKWGRGYAFEAAQGVISYAFGTLRLSHIMAGHHPENSNSRKILLRLGFRFDEYVFFPPTGLIESTYVLDSKSAKR
jgi:RimJ/RimL family protein N-acetyltransferase